MKENLLHFIWKLRLFPFKKLRGSNNEKIEVISTGIHNANTGPDFLNAKIKINDQLWVGNVEIHVNSSDWYVHHHEMDENYNAVILHVVWEHAVAIFGSNNQVITTLCLKNYISGDLLNKYHDLFRKGEKWIYCENDIGAVEPFVILHWIERLFFERLEQKSKLFHKVFKRFNNNWEATLFIALAKNFGLKINAEAFMNVAVSFDFSLVRKLASNNLQLEALFLGQAGLLLNSATTPYEEKLKEEYNFLRTKFGLNPIPTGVVQFFRLRPNNFPTIRLSQLATLYSRHQNLFSKIIEIKTMEGLYELFDIKTSKFWELHYTFETSSVKRVKKLSKPFIDLLIINTIIPLKFLYYKSLGKPDHINIIELIRQIKPEKNAIIFKFNNLKINCDSAFETQALLQLKQTYCNAQRCLECAIGKDLLKT